MARTTDLEFDIMSMNAYLKKRNTYLEEEHENLRNENIMLKQENLSLKNELYEVKSQKACVAHNLQEAQAKLSVFHELSDSFFDKVIQGR